MKPEAHSVFKAEMMLPAAVVSALLSERESVAHSVAALQVHRSALSYNVTVCHDGNVVCQQISLLH